MLKSSLFKLAALFFASLFSVIGWSQWATAQLSDPMVNPMANPVRLQVQTLSQLAVEAASLVPAGLERTSNPNEGGRGIIGSDNRVPMTSSAYPWSAVGRIVGLKASGDQYICTGALIAPDLVLTNAHCVYDAETHQLSQAAQFQPNLVNGRLQDSDDATFAVDAYAGTDFRDNPTPPHPDDWAILKLEQPIGRKYGTLGVAELSSRQLINSYADKLVLPGYSFDFPDSNPSQTAGVHLGCSITAEVQGVIVHNCDTRGGSSGGPILAEVDGDWKIVAVNSAEYANQETGRGLENYGVPMTRIMTAVRASAQ